MVNKVKINLVYYDFENQIATESIWAIKENDVYRVKSIPFFAPNISYDDLIKIEEDDGELFFDSKVKPSGNSTIQLVIYNKNDIQSITYSIEKFNCGWEGSHLKGYISVNIPKKVNYKFIKSYLDEMFDNKVLDYKEASLAHKL